MKLLMGKKNPHRGVKATIRTLLSRDDWYMRHYMPWSRRHQPYSYIINFGSVPVGLGLQFAFWWWLFGVGWATAVTALTAITLVVFVASAVYVGRRRSSR